MIAGGFLVGRYKKDGLSFQKYLNSANKLESKKKRCPRRQGHRSAVSTSISWNSFIFSLGHTSVRETRT